MCRPKNLGKTDKLPAVVLTHGWGGNKSTGARYAAKFAASGMIAICFTHGGFGESGGLAWISGDAPELDSNNEAVARIRVAREFVDPIDWIRNFRAAVNFAAGEPNVDGDRIGAWGTSYGGGIASYCAATDKRIKALVSQVGLIFDIFTEHEQLRVEARQRAIQMARGEAAPFPTADDAIITEGGSLAGAHLARMLEYDIDDKMRQLSIPTMIIDAENEKYFQFSHGRDVVEILKTKGVPVRYEVISGIGHYEIYFEGFERSSRLAHEWFVKNLLNR
jgi:fermentation-respiration switch protein FrsA (DUF1100 family)